jgi:hypothetical protein
VVDLVDVGRVVFIINSIDIQSYGVLYIYNIASIYSYILIL